MTRQELWESQYREARYMRQLAAPELDQRFFDVFNNYNDVTSKGLFAPSGFEGAKEPNLYWLEALTHVSEEYGLRGRGWPVADRTRVSMFSVEGYDYAKAARALEHVSAKRPFLARYSSRRYVTEMFETGRIRVAPASSYDDPSLDVARRDDELRVSNGRRPIMRARSDYLVYCLSATLKPRLFGDFAETDAVLVIHDIGEFFARLDKAAASLPFPWEGTVGAVKYFDPLRTDFANVVPGFWKHFRFAYQVEWRFTWFPHVSGGALKPVFLELGSLKDISETILLER
jgi:hypothetical protein